MPLKIRIDDFPGSKPDEFWKHNLENFKRFDYCMQKHGFGGYILGVIPLHTKWRDVEWLAEQDLTIALHGVVHDESTLDEFKGLSCQAIEGALLKAKTSLERHAGYRVSDYIPPHNTIGYDTALTLARLGFEHVYTGPETTEEMKKLINSFGMGFIHSEWPCEYGRSDELLECGSVEHIARDVNNSFDICLTLHWPWEYNIGLEHLGEYLSKLREAID